MLRHLIFMKEKLSGLLAIFCLYSSNVNFSKAKCKHVVLASEKIKCQIISYFEFLFYTKGISDPKENVWKPEPRTWDVRNFRDIDFSRCFSNEPLMNTQWIFNCFDFFFSLWKDIRRWKKDFFFFFFHFGAFYNALCKNSINFRDIWIIFRH